LSLSSVAYEILLEVLGPEEADRVMMEVYQEIKKSREERKFEINTSILKNEKSGPV
jgi:hypothetical protein